MFTPNTKTYDEFKPTPVGPRPQLFYYLLTSSCFIHDVNFAFFSEAFPNSAKHAKHSDKHLNRAKPVPVFQW